MRVATAILVMVAVSGVVQPLAAQQHGAHGGGAFPEGWQGRVDRANQNLSDVRFMRMGDAFHVVTGPHVILWNPANTAADAYRVSATFAQARAPERLEGYGLLVGGRDLDGGEQDYLYFLIRHDGRFMVRHRAGDEVHTLMEWTEQAAIRRPTATAGAENVLAIESRPDRVDFLANGETVLSLPRAPMLNTDGIAGMRIGHHVDVHISDFAIVPLSGQ